MNEMTRIDAAPADEVRTRLTAAEFLHMNECGAFDDMKVELVDGELQLMQYPRNNHAMRQAQLVVRLAAVVGEDRVRGEVGIVLGDDTALTCDVAVLVEPVTENRPLRPADLTLVIEVAETTRRRDLGMKRGKYAAAGIPYYWVIDGEDAVVHVHADPAGGDYASVEPVAFGDQLTVPGGDGTIIVG